jgi:hypothetical protein
LFWCKLLFPEFAYQPYNDGNDKDDKEYPDADTGLEDVADNFTTGE